MNELEAREAASTERLALLREKLSDASRFTGGNCCLYVTGSLGRGEATPASDLDVFILAASGQENKFSRQNEIRLKAKLIDVNEELAYPEFSGDGKWLTKHSINKLVRSLGRQSDDMTNAFTARLLLLLESKWLLDREVYEAAIDQVIAAYWSDFRDHEHDFVPAFLANDILRLWRTLCVNYEAYTKTSPEQEKLKRKVKNYKLKYSRLMTCYSAIVYLLAVFDARGTVTPSDAKDMVSRTPIGRIKFVCDLVGDGIKPKLDNIISEYNKFLTSAADPRVLRDRLSDADEARRLTREGSEFGEAVHSALDAIASEHSRRFYRMLVV